MRTFTSGATRDDDVAKPDYTGFLDPAVIQEFGRYMHEHRKQADGSLRAADNWRKGIPRDAFMASMFRHLVEVWDNHDNEKHDAAHYQHYDDWKRQKDALCALMFNVMGYLSQLIRGDVGQHDA